jgi:hypothetical protein
MVRRLGRFFVEYVGNLDVPEDAPQPVAVDADRRTDHRARKLVGWFKEEIEGRGLSEAKERELMNGVREAFRQEAAASRGDTGEEG